MTVTTRSASGVTIRTLLKIIAMLACASVVSAQTLVSERLRLDPGPCVVSSQPGPPIQLVMSGNCSGITTSLGTNLTLNPTGDLITDPAGKDVLPALNYDINLGMLSKKFLTLHAAELWVETLVAQNTIATIGGRVLVAPTNVLTVDLAPSDTTIIVKYNNFQNGDRVYMEANGAVEFMAVTSAPGGSGPYTYSVTRNLDGTGANQWYAGDALLDTGQVGNGFIDLYSTAGILSTGSGPTIVGNVRTGSTYNAYGPRWAVGNLNGLYGYGVTTYGAAFGDPSATNVTVDATNGFRIRSNTTNKFVADTAGNLSIVGDLSVGTSGSIRSGATGFSSGIGWFMDFNSGTPRFRIGDPAGNKLTWDGATLALTGAITAASGTIGGWSIGSTTLTGGSATLDSTGNLTLGTGNNVVRLSATDSTYRLWVGNATAGSAPFRVTTGGAVTASNATVTGTISGSTITGSTATFGGGAVTLDGNGLSITNGSGAVNKIKYNDGSYLYSSGGTFVGQAAGDWALQVSSGSAQYSISSGNFAPPNGADLGGSSNKWNTLWLIDTIKWSTPPTTTSDDYPVVYSNGNTQLYKKTNGYSGTCSSPSSIVIERGIVVGCS